MIPSSSVYTFGEFCPFLDRRNSKVRTSPVMVRTRERDRIWVVESEHLPGVDKQRACTTTTENRDI
jgi:hypothetical protein